MDHATALVPGKLGARPGPWTSKVPKFMGYMGSFKGSYEALLNGFEVPR